MGSTLSHIVQEAKDGGGTDLVIEQQDKIKAKEIAVLIQHLESELPQLVSLTVNSSKIKKLPSETGQSLVKLKELLTLRLEDNQLSQLPDSIALLSKKLQELSLAGNKFTAFPGTIIGLLQNLQSLNFSKNQLTTLDHFSGHKTLEYLNLSNNQFTEFPVDVCAMPNLKKLSLCDNQISAISEQIGKLVHLEHLELRGNKLTSLPGSLSKLTKLQHLDAAENELAILPNDLEALKHSLNSLELQHNKFTNIPQCVFHLTALRSLKMNDNRITVLPPQIANLVELTELYLQENSIAAIPPEIAQAASLRKIYLEFNKITSIPSEIRELKKLVVLILHHNEINTLPPAVRKMKTLLRFSLEHNPLDDKTLDVIRKDGALALIEKDEAPSVGPKYKTLNHGKSSRSVQSSSNYHSNNNSLSATATPTSNRSLNRRASAMLTKEKEPSESSSSSNSVSEFPTEGNYRMRSRSTTVTDFTLPVVIAPPSPEQSPVRERRSNTVSASDKDSVPSYSQFKTAFDTFLEDQDFSKEKTEALSKLPTEQKWSLMKEYKSSTLNMLKYNEKKPFSLSIGGPKGKSSKTTPQDYPGLLKGFRVLKDDLVTLQQCLTQNVDGWVAHFIEAGGILALLKLIEKHSLKKEQNYVDFILVGESLKSVKILLEVVLKSVLTTTDSINTIALNITCSHYECKFLSFDILEEICQIPYVGQGIVVEALKYHQKHRFPNSLPFDALMKMLSKSAKDKTNDLTLTIVSLINAVINNCDDLEIRFDLRKNFVNQGLLEIFKNFRKDISELLLIQLDIFEENMFRDEEDMIQKYGRMEVWDRMRRNSNSDSIGDFIRVAAIVNPVQTPTGLVPYVPETVIGKLIDNMCHMFSVDIQTHAQVRYGLYVYQGKDSGFWLEDQKKMGDYKFKGEIFSELKMRPWTCAVRDLAQPTKEHKVVVDPNADCAAIVNQFLSQLISSRSPRPIKIAESQDEDSESDEEEYQLFLCGAGVKGKPLVMDDTRKLYEYASAAIKLPQIVFELQIKARALKVYLGSTEDTTVFYFLPSTSLHKIKKKILKQLMSSGEISKTYGNKQLTVEDYGILVEKPGVHPTATWEEETKKLSDFSRGITVRVMLRPRNFNVLLPSGQQKTIRVDLSKPVKQVIDEILSDQPTKDSNQLDYLLCYQPHSQNNSNVGSVVPLKLNKSFRDQRVPLDITLSMTPVDQNAPVEDDVNIWEETEPVTYEDEQHTQISYATFNKLVEFLTSADDLHMEFSDVFFLTYKAFTTPQKCLDKFIERYKVPARVEAAEATKIKMRVCIVLKNWMENKYETNHNDIKDQVNEFINTLIKKDFPELVPALTKAVDRAKVAVMQVGTQDAPPKPKLPKNLSDNITLLQIDPLELARQMTLQMFDVYKKINQTEFFGQAWTKPHKGLSPNILKAIAYFNDISCWVSTAIVSEKKIRDRVKVFEIFVRVAAELQELNNFHILFALITAFNTSAVSRLKWTKEKLSKRAKQLMADLEDLMSMQGSFKKYREHLGQVAPPCIPYIGVYLTDLIFIEDGNPDKIGNRINFSKQLYMYKVLSTIQKFQARAYNNVPVPSIQRFLDSAPKLDEKEMYSLSQKIEPRGATRNDIE